jgi:para-nitrobenzyl esterase
MDAPVANTALGDLQGAWIDGVAAFLGVPYASPPVGPLRLAPAAPVQSWSGKRDATRHGPISPQLPPRLSAIIGNSSARPQDEDCLTLTIRTPAPDQNARPVVVWLHGGALLSGAGSLDMTDGSRLAREGDIVFVGVNYRLGALGWLHRPGIVDAEPGMSDIIAALSWLRDHIASFGGDPSRVTLMGQSAGADVIARLLMMPEARALFGRAILQSPALGAGFGFMTSDVAARSGASFLRLLDIDPDADDALERLRAIDVPRLLQAQGGLMRLTARFARPAPPFRPLVPTAMTLAEEFAAITDGIGSGTGGGGKEILIGVTADEGHAFFAADPAMENPLPKAVSERFGGEARLACYRARRPGAKAMDLLADLLTDETFLLPAMGLAEAIAVSGGSVHAYIFDWAPPTSRFRSCHVIELPFVFGTYEHSNAPMLAGGAPAQMEDLSASIRGAWIAFVRDGSPEHHMLPSWPRHDVTRRSVMRFGTRIGIVSDPAGLAQPA